MTPKTTYLAPVCEEFAVVPEGIITASPEPDVITGNPFSSNTEDKW